MRHRSADRRPVASDSARSLLGQPAHTGEGFSVAAQQQALTLGRLWKAKAVHGGGKGATAAAEQEQQQQQGGGQPEGEEPVADPFTRLRDWFAAGPGTGGGANRAPLTTVLESITPRTDLSESGRSVRLHPHAHGSAWQLYKVHCFA